MIALDLLNMGLQTLLLGAGGYLLVCLLLKDARHRAWASLLSLVAMVLLPWMPLRQVTEAPSEPPNSSAWRPEWRVTLSEPTVPLVRTQGAEMVVEPSTWRIPHWTGILVWIWGAGSGWMVLRHLWRTAAIHRWKRRLRLHQRDGMQVRVAEDLASPCLAGAFKPQIVVPDRAVLEWSAKQWRWAMVHEQEHERGGDPLIAWCVEWVRAALWWNPLPHRLIAEWEQAREEICDRAAVDRADEAAPYSEFLLLVASASRSPGVAMAVSRPARRLKARLISLLEQRPVRRWPHWAFPLLVAGMLVLGFNLLGCVSLERTTSLQDDGPLLTRRYNVAPEILPVLCEEIPADPTAVNQGVRLTTQVSVQQGLQNYGVDFPKGTSAVLDLATSQLVVMNKARRLEQVERVLNALAENSAFQDVLISIRTKGIEVRADTPSVPDLSVLTEPQFQTVLRSFNEQKGSVIHMGEPVKGRKIMLFLTASLVNPSGEELSMAAAMKKRRKGSVFPSGGPLTPAKSGGQASP